MKEIKEDRIAISIVQKIIRKGISNQIAFNIMDFKDCKEMWDKLKSIYTKVGQRVVKVPLQTTLLSNNLKPKPLRYNSDCDCT